MKKKPKFKQKSQHRRPPLSLLDKILYWSAFFLVTSASLASVLLFEDIRGRIAFRDPAAVAAAGDASFLFLIPLILYLEISCLTYILVTLEEKHAIFPHPKIKYGQDPWDKEFFPLSDHRRGSVPVDPVKKPFRHKTLLLWCVGLLLCLVLAPYAFFGRACLQSDHSIVSYDFANRISATYYAEDFAHLTLRTRLAGGKSTYWTYEMVIEMHDGRTFVFSDRDFGEKGEAHKELSLRQMLEIKAHFSPNTITCQGAEDVDKVAEDRGLNETQTQQLHQLFDN